MFFYSLQTVGVGLASIGKSWFKVIDTDSFKLLLFILSIFHYSNLSLFILSIKKPTMNIKFIRVYVVAGITTAFLLLLFSNYQKPYLLFMINNLTIFILCCFYFARLFSSTEVVVIKNEPSFWVVAGILICMCITLPFAAYRFFLFTESSKYFIVQENLFSITAIGYIIMHLFFIKAYLCLVASTTK